MSIMGGDPMNQPLAKIFSLFSVAFLFAVAPVDAQDTRYGGILTLANRSDPPAGFDSMRTSSIALHHVGGAIFGAGNLVMRCRENSYDVCPYLATHWTANREYTEWIFAIRTDVYWHDGVQFTAEDVKFWFDLVFFGAEANGNIRAPAYFATELGDIDTVQLLEHNRVKLTFKQRNPYLAEILANPRFKIAHPKHLMEPLIRNGNVSVSPLDVGLVGIGPFSVSSYRKGSLIRLERNDRYFEVDGQARRLPYLDGIDYVIMPDPFAMDIAFRTGRLDGGARGQGHYLSAERIEGYVRDLGNDVYFAEMDGGNFRLAFNVLREGPWQDSRVRRAIALWIDKPAAVSSALGGYGWTTPELGPAHLPVLRYFINWPKIDREPLAYRRERARALIAEAGYANGFTMDHLVRGLNPVTGEFLKAQLAGLGVDLNLRVVDEGEWNRARVSLDYDSQQGSLTPSPIPEGTISVYGRYSKNPDAYAKHEDAKVDELYFALRNAASIEQRIRLWREIEEYLFHEMTYIIPIAEAIYVVPYRSYVKGLAVPIEDAHTHTDFATVWLEEKT
ncbi:MAG: ABC transporter substrate-binding protein [Spirochaetales bacterium]|nr:ABC transporter substrate-binding protein [Spirochaetales bacterium]